VRGLRRRSFLGALDLLGDCRAELR
jgi:hypothetical protein